MFLWLLEFAGAMHHSLPEVPGLTAASVDEDRPELPAAEGDLPAAEGELPVAEGELPAAEGELPVVEGELPAAEAAPAEGELPAAVVETPEPAAAVETPEPAAAVDEGRPAAALDEEELAAVEERPVPQTPVVEPVATCSEDRLAAALHSLSFAIDGLARAISSRPASVPGSVVPLRGARAMGAPGSVVPSTPGPRRGQRCRECGPCLAKLAAGVSRPPCESWAAVPGLERDSAGRFLPRTPAKREPAGDESDALDTAEEFNIDDLLASPVPAEKKAKSKKRRKLPPHLSSKDHRDHGGPGDGHGGAGDGRGPGGCGAPVEVGNYF